MALIAFDTLEELAEAVRALPAAGPLPARTVLVRSERQAHALRVVLSGLSTDPTPEGARRAILAGTRFVGPLSAAEDVLHAAGVTFSTGESALRPARLGRLFASGVELHHFDPAHLASTPGWDDAFAGAIHTLESAGLRPADLPGEPPALADLGALWAEADREAGPSFTAARLYAEAAAALEQDPGRWPFPGAVLAPVDGHEPAALARFLRAIPGATLALRRARPARERWVAGLAARFGEEARALALHAASAGPATTELARLQALLFHPDPAFVGLPPGRGPDGSVALEEHAGVESELDAAAAWAARQVLEHRTPLSRIALLVPALDPLAGLAADRLERLGLRAHVAGAMPAVSTSAGARVLAVLRALRRRLPAGELAAVLPSLRLEEPSLDPGAAARPPRSGGAVTAPGAFPRGHLSHGAALALAFSLGTPGGSPARPEGALEWSRRAQERLGELGHAIDAARRSAGSDERELWQLEARLADLRAVHASLDGLVGVARAVARGASLEELAGALLTFVGDAVLLPGGKERLLGPLEEALAPARASALGDTLRGDAALQVIEQALLGLRVGRGRFGEPAVYVGTVAGAAGLSFDAVRILGLAEGSIPSAPREDPVLPEPLRAAVGRAALLRAPEDAVLAQLHAFHAVVLGTRRTLALSAPRVDLARTEREPAALFVEVAAALGRPDAVTGAAAPPVPDAQALRRDAFEPARAEALAFRARSPIGDGAWLARVAAGERALPPAWRGAPALDLARIEALFHPGERLGPRDGVLAPGEPFPTVPGLVPERSISASALQVLLACPRRFFMQRLLGWDEPGAAPPLRALDAASFGTLLHRVHERLYRAHGAAIVAGQGELEAWIDEGLALADAAFEEFLLEVPLVGERIREKERDRLRAAVRSFLEYDWHQEKGSRFVDVERAFGGEAAPLPLAVAGGPLFVRGFIDRLDATPKHAVVRDLKSGAAHPRRGDEAGPVPGRDVQLGLYAKVTRVMSRAWGLPAKVVGAYAYANGKTEVREREFRGDPQVLEAATEGWLGLARGLLAGHQFPTTSEPEDCTFCPFQLLCGAEEPARARAGLALEEDGMLAAFRAMKGGGEE